MRRGGAGAGTFGMLLAWRSAAALFWLLLPTTGVAQGHSSVSRWSVGMHFGDLSTVDQVAMELGAAADSADPLAVGVKDAARAGLTLWYDAYHDTGFGVSIGATFSQAALDVGLVNTHDHSFRRLGDATVRIAAVSLSIDLGDHALFDRADHNNFLLATGIVLGAAWLSPFTLEPSTVAQAGIARISGGSEPLLGFQSRLLWRIFGTRWVASAGGALLLGGGDGLLDVRTEAASAYASGKSAINFGAFDLGLSYRL